MQSKTRGLIAVGSALILTSAAAHSATYTFQTLDNPGDPQFNQLLGVNNAGTIAGYFGDGSTVQNKGYTLVAPSSYTAENFPASVQTQVTAINNAFTPVTGGFYVDAAGNNVGFVNQGGVFHSISDPSTPASGTTVNQILGLNDNGQAAGFYVDGSGHSQAYVYNISALTSTPVALPGTYNAVSTTATGINNANVVAGFYVDTGGKGHGFLDIGGSFESIDDPSGTHTEILGINNNDLAVGSYIDAAGETQGFVFNWLTDMFQTISDPSASATAAFGITGTTVNGINDAGVLVGFYSDGTYVNGFEATPSVPEPATLSLLGLGLAGVGFVRRRKSS